MRGWLSRRLALHSLQAEAEDATQPVPDGMGAGAGGGRAEAHMHGWEARWLAVCEESVVSGRVTAAKIMWRRLQRCQREALKTAAYGATFMRIDGEAKQVLPADALDVRDDWRAQWVRVCVGSVLAETKSTAEAVEDLWFSLRQDQRAALLTMALVLFRAKRAAWTPDLDGDSDCDQMWQSDDSNSELYPDGASNKGGGSESAVLARLARGDGGGGGSDGDGAWQSPESMERYASVQHKLRSGWVDSQLGSTAQVYWPWHGYISSIVLQIRHASALRELRAMWWTREQYVCALAHACIW